MALSQATVNELTAIAGADAANDLAANSLNPQFNRAGLNQGTPYDKSDSAVSILGWGTQGAAQVQIGSTDSAGAVLVTAYGGGETRNPFVSITFKDGPWSLVPFVNVTPIKSSGLPLLLSVTATTTGFVVTFEGTAADGFTYGFNWQVVGTK